jgi:monoamine oxidase
MIHRGRFLRGTLGAAASLVLTPMYGCATSPSAGRAKVAIVGAGIAGLTAAMTLRDGGIEADVYESSGRVGGRMHTQWGYWNEGQHTEWCGSMIDSKHRTIRALAARFHQPIVDTWKTLQPGWRDTAYVDGKHYSMIQADKDFAPVYATLQQQLKHLGENTTYDSATPLAKELDKLSMAQWIEKYVPGGRTSNLGRTIDVALMNEQGVPSEQQSALNLVYMLGIQYNYAKDHEDMNVLGYSDQRYTTVGGNQRIPIAIAASLRKASIAFNHRLTALAKRSAGGYELTFTAPNGAKKAVYDQVVLAIPFLILRGVDLTNAGFDALKMRAIDELGYGMHTKLQMQFDSRVWYEPGPWEHPADGQIWTDTGFQNSVDFSLGQRGSNGIIECFTGGTQALIDAPPMPYSTANDSPAVTENVKRFFKQLDLIWPGVSKHWNGKAAFGNAQADPNIQGSYSCWLVGQQTGFAGYERVRQGNVHFAGEHTSVEFQGFMEGGAISGVTAGREVLADYGIAPRRSRDRG